jgi:hypothetical protein
MNDIVLDTAGSAGAAPAATPRERSRWPVRVLMLAALGAVLLLGLAWLAQGLGSLSAPVHVAVDGNPVFSGWNGSDMPPAHRVVLAAVIFFGTLAALVIVPIALVVGLALMLLILLAVIGLPLVLLLAGVGLLLSPLLLLIWFVWKIAT